MILRIMNCYSSVWYKKNNSVLKMFKIWFLLKEVGGFVVNVFVVVLDKFVRKRNFLILFI